MDLGRGCLHRYERPDLLHTAYAWIFEGNQMAVMEKLRMVECFLSRLHDLAGTVRVGAVDVDPFLSRLLLHPGADQLIQLDPVLVPRERRWGAPITSILPNPFEANRPNPGPEQLVL